MLTQHDGRAIIPLETVRDDYFWHLTLDRFARKLARGEMAIPLVRLETRQKSRARRSRSGFGHVDRPAQSCRDQGSAATAGTAWPQASA
ncbi:hypothetical protein ATO4_20606 [Aurantimonas sp. 22II-16-19i]|nr:hypothetical protein ATO4_20606 [Aurantimonas sp. 22II-16-19i]